MKDWLTLDFGNDKVCFFDEEMDTGTLACEALNIPEETIAELCELGLPLTVMAASFQSNHVDITQIPTVRDLQNKILKLEAPANFPGQKEPEPQPGQTQEPEPQREKRSFWRWLFNKYV